MYVAERIGLGTSEPTEVVSVARVHNADAVVIGLWIGLASGAGVIEVTYLISTFEPQFQVIKYSRDEKSNEIKFPRS